MKAGLSRIAVTALCVMAARSAVAQDPVPPPPSRPSTAPAAISGVVLKLPNGDPAAGASVKVLDEPFGSSPPGARTKMTTAAPDGSFLFDSLEPGNYWIVANLPGFMPTEYGQRSPTGQGISIAVQAGQRATGVRLAMAPTSTISGRVFGEDGEPAGRVQVLALRIVYRDGKPVMTIAQTAMSDDRGEYRLFWLPPASYRVAARPWHQASDYPAANIGPPKRFGTAEQGSGPVVDRRRLATGAVVEDTYVPMYAPGTPDPRVATMFALAPGENASADIQLAGNRVSAHHVRGIVTNNTGDQARLPQRVTVVPREPSPMVAVPSALLQADGSFDVSGVPPGSYTIYARGGEGALPIEVGDADVDGVVVPLTNGINISGRITVERGASDAAIDLSRLRFVVERDPDVVGAPTGGPAFNPPAGADGAFTLLGVKPGDYRVSIPPILVKPGESPGRAGGFDVPPSFRNAYVKSMRWGRADVLAGGLHTWSPAQGPLDVVISLNGSELEGTVLDNARERVANVVVVAVPEGEGRDRNDLFKSASTDRSGHFRFRGMAPGDYTVYAWYDAERGAWQTPEFLRAFEGRGRFVRLREGQNDPLELTVISR
jgi:hypothetical protein